MLLRKRDPGRIAAACSDYWTPARSCQVGSYPQSLEPWGPGCPGGTKVGICSTEVPLEPSNTEIWGLGRGMVKDTVEWQGAGRNTD